MSDFDEEAAKRSAALALLEDDDHAEFEHEAHEQDLAHQAGHLSQGEVFGEDDLDRADRAQRMAPGDSLSQKAMIRQDVWADLKNIAPFARINPPSVLAGTLGGQQTITVLQDLTLAKVQPIPQLPTANWGGPDAETLPVTVTFAPVQQVTQQYSQMPILPYGIVQFGTRGFSVKAEVDIATGVQFTINASAVTLQVTLEDPGAFFAPPGSVVATVILAGMLSFYPTTHTTNLTRTKKALAFTGPSVPATFAVPPFSRNVTIFNRNYATVSMVIDFQDVNLNTVYSVPVAAGAPMQIPIPLSSEISNVSVNIAGALNSVITAIFGLAF